MIFFVYNVLHEKMSNARQTQQTHDSSQRISDSDIIAKVIRSSRGHLTGIGPTIKKYVREQVGSSQQSASSQSFVPFEQFQALQRKMVTMEAQVLHMYNFMSREHPESVQGMTPPG